MPGLIALLLLGAVLTFFSVAASAFASDSGAQDPVGAHFSETMIAVLPVYFICVMAAVVLMILGRGRLALWAAVSPFLYFVGALILTLVRSP
ncbi:hypothetical protein DEFR109230_17085 [Deinococcus frigens]|nr:hypothetical protein [Deinococcus frigens]